MLTANRLVSESDMGHGPIVEVTKAKIMASMPKRKNADGSNSAPVHYKGGVIYCAFAQRAFRALTTRGDNYSEKMATWKSTKPSVEAWAKVVKEIEKVNK